ncbi:serine/threonine-protein kinase afc2 [Pycnococcus provasolii]|uniref:Serine/threonine-protein kinase afc2 n=1 Tax=Pycnococcus provasolii TaxID=41880 RepID=A0A830H611_9CHLO|nr:serine/threonine-protein kinase afc2 [Pycnococcus provasolii]|mmetsp:Transcript_7502/g.19588  ORF Transcript_7502/g.19588 Transcript_7502/m.19588 type:complete len:364 (-) Transcript_7502:2870-3961(-)
MSSVPASLSSLSAHAANANSKKAMLKLGVVADVQHGLIPNKISHTGRVQHFRATRWRLEQAVDEWLEVHQTTGELHGVLNLGDSLEGDWDGGANQATKELEAIATQFDRLQDAGLPVLHVAGNHCLRHLPGTLLAERLDFPPTRHQGVVHNGEYDDDLYYAYQTSDGFRVVALDTCELSGLPECAWPGYSLTHRDPQRADELREEAHAMCDRLRAEASARNEPDPPQLCRWNGGVSKRQMSFLRQQLQESRKLNEKVLVMSHHPLKSGAARESALCWNHHEVSACLDEFSDVVLGSVCGHDHHGGYVQSDTGVHFVTLEAMLEAESNAFGIMSIVPHSDDGDELALVIQGVGYMTNRYLTCFQ